MSEFVHLKLHSEYSLQDSLIRLPELIVAVKALKMRAIALTDHCNLFAAIKVYQEAVATGIKPIIGADIYYTDPETPDVAYLMVLLCQKLKLRLMGKKFMLLSMGMMLLIMGI